MAGYEYVFWDWNGTLMDDVYVALASVNDILARRGRAPIDLERYYSLMATPITLFYERLFAPEKPDFPALSREFHEGYDRHLPEHGLAVGARETLEAIARAGIRQALVSSSEAGRLVRQVRALGIDGLFENVAGQDDFSAGSKLCSVRRHIALAGVAPEKALMLGDLEHDAEVAHDLGCGCLLYSGGHQSRRVLEALGAPVIDRIPDALHYIMGRETCLR